MTPNPVLFSFRDDDVLLAPPMCGLVAGPQFLRCIETWCERRDLPPGAALTVDLTPVTEFDLSMFRTLVWAGRRCRQTGRDLVLALPTAPIFEPNEEQIVRQLFRVVDELYP